MQRMEQGVEELAWGLHLLDVKGQRLARDEGAQQTRFSHTLRPEYQQGLAYLSLAPQTGHFFFSLHTNQIFTGRVAWAEEKGIAA